MTCSGWNIIWKNIEQSGETGARVRRKVKMYVVYKAFNTNKAIIVDLSNYMQLELNENQLIRLSNNHNIIGLSVYNQKIKNISAYDCISFEIESEADEYLRDVGLSYQNKLYINRLYWVLEKRNIEV